MIIAKAQTYPVGSVRRWNNRTYRKEDNGRWVPIADKRGHQHKNEQEDSTQATGAKTEAAPTSAKEVADESKQLRIALASVLRKYV